MRRLSVTLSVTAALLVGLAWAGPARAAGPAGPAGRAVAGVEKRGEAVSEHAEHDGTSQAQPGRGPHEEDETPKPMNLVDFGNKEQPPYVAALINFGLLALLYYGVGRKPLAEGLKSRRATIVKDIEEAQRMKREAEARAKEYQAKLANLEDELAATKRALEDAGKTDRERIVKEAEEKAARLQKDASFLLDQEMKQMRQDLVRETVEIAVAAAEDLLKKRVTPEDQDRMAEEFLRSLEGRRSPAQGQAT